jgi:Phage capsid protein
MGPITDEHKLSYKMNVALALQQMRSKLEPAFTFTADLKGRKAQFLDLIGQTNAVRNIGRKADTPDIDSPTEPIFMLPTQIAWGRIMELEDVIKAIMDYQSSFIRSGTAAVVREGDMVRRDAIFGSRRIGQDGATVSAWAGDTVTVGIGASATDDTTATGMNVRKLIRGLRLMQQRQVDIDMEQLFCLVNAQGMEELYRDLTYVNTDYRASSILEGRQVRRILATDIIVLDGVAALPDNSGTEYTFAMWCKSGLTWGDFDPLRTDIPLRPDKMNRPHPHMEWWMGASRTEDYKVVKIISKK